ncbi:type II secretion system F family protein [Massilia sp. YIM B02763]|uniref:type II secretion system F family protein n=1 Tax=Massilia sp. YIM B02763 TaxID=3050130 RepID=UPI0025B642C9|nr:type II secretion system F family protein [Massilia sp. YIM B02763]MDN4055901.1 type II secretion system F family protein [Massilia sp. YIM B02763]
MKPSQLLFLALIFILIFGAAILAMLLLTRNPLKNRLSALDEHDSGKGAAAPETSWRERLARVAAPLAKLSVPSEGWETSPLRLRFINAGWRAPSAPGLFHAGKTALTLGLPLVAWLVLREKSGESGSTMLIALTIAAGAGYYLPDLILKRKVALRQRDIFESFPDALDLMTVCVEAGLGMDAALARVGAEIGLKSPVLAEELQLVTLELRAGIAKDKALRNLALRTGVEDVDGLVKMLIQADRFGTSVGTALRVQSDQLRTRRRQIIEEKAGKIATKLLFPLIFCIFPALLVVLLGPAVLQIMRSLGPMLGSNGG